MPSRADTAPSCIAPSPESPGSSSWSATTPPHSRWYWSALRSVPACTTGLPSSVNPSAPASRSSAISVSSSPLRLRVIAARKPTGTFACRCRRVGRAIGGSSASSTTGSVFGIAITAQKPPAAAAAVPVSRFSLYSWPGRAQVHVRVDEPRERVHALGVDRDLRVRGRLRATRARRARRCGRRGSGCRAARRARCADRARGRRRSAARRARPLRWNRRSVVAHHATAARLGAPTSNSYRTAILTATPALT